jgi:hypothetical protein
MMAKQKTPFFNFFVEADMDPPGFKDERSKAGCHEIIIGVSTAFLFKSVPWSGRQTDYERWSSD